MALKVFLVQARFPLSAFLSNVLK
jgi:hypothetical protein